MISYIYKKQEYKNLLPLNEKGIFENVPLVVVKMKNGTMKVVNMKFPLIIFIINIFQNMFTKICFLFLYFCNIFS